MAISGVGGNFAGETGPAASLLFAAGDRPGAAIVRELAERHGEFSISLDPRAVAASAEAGQARAQGEPVWLELLAGGVTFDLLGLAPGPAVERPPCAYSYDLEEAAIPGVKALTLRPGLHLAGGETMLPVVRSLARLAASLARCDGVAAVAWHSSRSW